MHGPQQTKRSPRRSLTSKSLLARTMTTAAAMIALAGSTANALAQRDRRPQFQPPDSFLTIDPGTSPFSLEQLRDVVVDPQVMEIVRQLESAEFAQREAASEQLRANDDWRLQMYALLAGDAITAEQRCRLLQVVRTQLVNTPRGALGVEMAPPLPVGGQAMEIRVVDLIPGLPAERILQVGDRIVAIDNRPLFIQDDLQSRVQAKRPGDLVNVTVKRARVDDNGRVLKDANNEAITDVVSFDIALGSAEILDRQNRNIATVSNRVRNARRMEAEAVTAAFAPRPQEIAVQGGLRQITQEDLIDQHPVILNLIVQQDMLNERNTEQMKMMQEVWRRQLLDLKELANHPGLSEDERARMRRVAERFSELMNSVQ